MFLIVVFTQYTVIYFRYQANLTRQKYHPCCVTWNCSVKSLSRDESVIDFSEKLRLLTFFMERLRFRSKICPTWKVTHAGSVQMGSGVSFEVRMASWQDIISAIFYVLVLEELHIFQDGSPIEEQTCDGSLACPVDDSRYRFSKMATSSLSLHLLSVFQASLTNPYRRVLVENG